MLLASLAMLTSPPDDSTMSSPLAEFNVVAPFAFQLRMLVVPCFSANVLLASLAMLTSPPDDSTMSSPLAEFNANAPFESTSSLTAEL